MTRRVRLGVLGLALPCFGALLGWAVAGLPRFGEYRGPYGYLLNDVVVPLRHTTNVVIGVTFDVRGIDTLGEEFILYAAVLGVALLLRDEREPRATGEASERLGTDGARLLGILMVGGGVLVGLWLITFGYVTPGGGFQGGGVVAAAVLLLYLVGSHRDYEPFRNEEVLDPLEAVGVGGFVAIGLAALGTAPFLTNLFGLGEPGTLLSGGSIPFVNWASGIAVTVAMVLIFAEFLEAYIVPLSRSQKA